MNSNRAIYHTYIYLGGISLLAASLPLSKFLISLSQIILVANWLAEDNLKNRMSQVWKRKSLLFFLLIYFVHLLWLINTQDFDYALHDLKIKLPFLALPLVMGTSRVIRENEIKMILLVFTGAILVSSLFSIYRLSTMAYSSMTDFREISVFISHIRLSLLINIAIFGLLYLLITGSFQRQRIIRNSLWMALAWLILFLFILQSVTGIIIFIVTGFLFLLRFSPGFEKRFWYIRYPLLCGLSALLLTISIYTVTVILSFSSGPIGQEKLKTMAPSGNLYEHQAWNRQMENGNYVWINISEEELAREWNRKSSIGYRELHENGHEVRHTIIRYLTSLGLDKDSAGLAQLTPTDIRNIERGMANHIYQNNKWIYPRIYQLVWEVDNYLKGNNPSGHSLAQRFEYWKTGFAIISNNAWFGVGTGDVASAYESQYVEDETVLDPEWRLRAHNQFITFLISFGLPGFLIVMFGMFAPFFIEKRGYQIMPFTFACVALLSMLTEDTFETQAGATFIAFFYSLFIFAMDKHEPDNDEKEDRQGSPFPGYS